LKRPSWSSNVRIVEWYKIFISSIWVLYLALEIDQFKRFALPIYKFVSNYNFLKDIISILYVNRVITLLVLTIPTILFWFLDIIFKKVNYKKLDPELFPEYDLDDHPYQTRLVEFLNIPDSIHNVFWLDGSWGSGKTFFIKTFFVDPGLDLYMKFYTRTGRFPESYEELAKKLKVKKQKRSFWKHFFFLLLESIFMFAPRR